MQPKVVPLKIPNGLAVALPDKRVAMRSGLTATAEFPLPIHLAKTLHQGLVNGAQAIELRGQIVGHRGRDRRCPEPPIDADIPWALRVRGQPGSTAGEQLARRIDGTDEITRTDTTALRPTRGGGQPLVIRQRDVRPGEIHRRQRQPPEPSCTRQVGIVSPAAEHVRRISTHATHAIDGHSTHDEPPR